MSEFTVTACSIIDRVVAEESQRSDFVRAQARVSAIGMCPRKTVAQALGHIQSDISWTFSKGGHVLQAMAFHRILRAYPFAVEEVSVPTSVPKTWTHPDIYIPNLGLGIQVKSCHKSKIVKYLKTGEGLPNRYNVDQCLLEWFYWRKAGFCLTENREKLPGFPHSYELLYIAREDFIETRCSIPVEWDPVRAGRLDAELQRRHELIAWGEVPDKTKASPNDDPWWECGATFGNQPPSVCPFYEKCWGRAYKPPTSNGWRR